MDLTRFLINDVDLSLKVWYNNIMEALICTLECARWRVTGKCIHVSELFKELVAEEKKVSNQLIKDAVFVRRRRKNNERLERAMFAELEIPNWHVIEWVNWRLEVRHLSYVYVLVDVNNKIMVVGDAIDLWKRLFTWSRDSVIGIETVKIWCLQTMYTKEIVEELRRLLHWLPGQLRDVMRRKVATTEPLNAALKVHPMWELNQPVALEEFDGPQGAD